MISQGHENQPLVGWSGCAGDGRALCREPPSTKAESPARTSYFLFWDSASYKKSTVQLEGFRQPEGRPGEVGYSLGRTRHAFGPRVCHGDAQRRMSYRVSRLRRHDTTLVSVLRPSFVTVGEGDRHL